MPDAPLTQLEIETLRGSMDGQPPAEIARRLQLSETEVRTQVASAMRKLDRPTKYQAVLRALQLGLLTCPASGAPDGAGRRA